MHIMLGFLLFCACIVAVMFLWRALLVVVAAVVVAFFGVYIYSNNLPPPVAPKPAISPSSIEQPDPWDQFPDAPPAKNYGR